MVRQRAPSAGSENSSVVIDHNQELGSMYDYLAKIVLLGPSGCGKSCLLHRFVRDEWRVLTSQTIGVEFSSKIIRVGTGARRKRIKLQLWDTAGTERFRSVSRSYYRGAAGAILVYDLASLASFTALPTFLNDARALASPNLTLLLVGNKSDLASTDNQPPAAPKLVDLADADTTEHDDHDDGRRPAAAALAATREVSPAVATAWASRNTIPCHIEASALSGALVHEIFTRLAAMIVTKIELGEVDPDDPQSGIQYGDLDFGAGGGSEAGSVKSGLGGEGLRRRPSRRGRGRGWLGGLGVGGRGLREWEEVFRLDGGRGGGGGGARGRRGGCC